MIFAYYVMLSMGQALAEQDSIPAIVGLWLPNAVFAVLGVWLFGQAARERTVTQLERLQNALAAVREKVIGRLGAESVP
jgi:hypothetical protein